MFSWREAEDWGLGARQNHSLVKAGFLALKFFCCVLTKECSKSLKKNGWKYACHSSLLVTYEGA